MLWLAVPVRPEDGESVLNILSKENAIARRLPDRAVAVVKVVRRMPALSAHAVAAWWRRAWFIRNRSFTIISVNCLGGVLYQRYGLPYRTPTVGLYFYGDDFLSFMERLHDLGNLPLSFASRSKHDEVNLRRAATGRYYPIGVLGEGIEIQFLHYRDEQDVRDKWMRRCARIDLNNLFVLYHDRDGFKEEYLGRFGRLPYVNKVFLTARRYDFPWALRISEYENEPFIGDLCGDPYLDNHLDVAAWLNGGGDARRFERFDRSRTIP